MSSLLKYIVLLLPLAPIPLLFHRSQDAGILGRYSIQYAALQVAAFCLCGLLAYIFISDERRIRLIRRFSDVGAVAVIACGLSVLIISSFFLPKFVLTLKYNASYLVLACLTIILVALFFAAAEDPKALMAGIALSTTAVCLLLVGIEIALRFTPHRGFGSLPDHSASAVFTNENAAISWGEALRLSQNHDRVYEFMPGSRFTFLETKVFINSQGFRCAEYSTDKPDNVIRVIGLGDSVMFGWGVEGHESFLSITEKTLNSGDASPRYEILNLAVPGYNTYMEVATFKEKGLHYEPDLVVLSYVDNDLDLPNFIRSEPTPSDLGISFLADLLRGTKPGADRLIGAPGHPTDSRHFENDPMRVPAQYRHMVGTNALYAAFEKLAFLSESNGFDVIVMSHVSLPEFVKDACKLFGFGIIETTPYWEVYCEENDIKNPLAVWNLTNTDPHPSATGHMVIATALVNAIRDWAKRDTEIITP